MKPKRTFASRPLEHTFRARFNSGNFAVIRFNIPDPGRRVRFLVNTARTMSKRDHTDCDKWLETVRQEASRIAGRALTLRSFSISTRSPAMSAP